MTPLHSTPSTLSSQPARTTSSPVTLSSSLATASQPNTKQPTTSQPTASQATASLTNYYQTQGVVTTMPLIRRTAGKRLVTTFTVALPHPAHTGSDYTPLTWQCIAWGPLAAWISYHVHEGDTVALDGFFRRRRFFHHASHSYHLATNLQCHHVTVLHTAPNIVDDPAVRSSRAF